MAGESKDQTRCVYFGTVRLVMAPFVKIGTGRSHIAHLLAHLTVGVAAA